MYVEREYFKNQNTELIERAENIIDRLTHNRIIAVGFHNLTEFQRKMVRKACILTVEYIVEIENDGSMDIVSYNLHGMQVNMKNKKLKPWEEAGCGVFAWMTLMQTGLMRGGLS